MIFKEDLRFWFSNTCAAISDDFKLPKKSSLKYLPWLSGPDFFSEFAPLSSFLYGNVLFSRYSILKKTQLRCQLVVDQLHSWQCVYKKARHFSSVMVFVFLNYLCLGHRIFRNNFILSSFEYISSYLFNLWSKKQP